GAAAERLGDKVSLLAVGIGDADEFGARQASEDTRMIRAHHADADHADTQRPLHANGCLIAHADIGSPARIRAPAFCLPCFARGWRRFLPNGVNTFCVKALQVNEYA